MRNVKMRFDEHTNSRSNSEPARHLRVNPPHFCFTWRILCMAQSTTKRRIVASNGNHLKKDRSIATSVAKLLPSGIT